ncbi:Lamin A C, partial [Cichlidogyrus casuarinus]
PPAPPRNQEVLARTQFDRSYKGAISVDDCAPDGKYVQLTNNSNMAQNIHGWRLRRDIDFGKQVVRYTFDDCVLEPRSSLRIWARGFKGPDAPGRDLESSYSTWGIGNFVKTTLYDPNGEKSLHLQLLPVLLYS